jgi:sporulation protein YlmC with PRC-barrel domain
MKPNIKTILLAATCSMLVGGAVFAQQPAAPAKLPAAQMMTTMPASSSTVTNYYKQDVYDPSDAKIGTINDVLIDKEGRVTALMIGVGGFLGMGEKDVAVPFAAVHGTEKNSKWYLVMNTTKDALKSAPGYKYDKTKTSWMLDKS